MTQIEELAVLLKDIHDRKCECIDRMEFDAARECRKESDLIISKLKSLGVEYPWNLIFGQIP